MSVAPVRKSLSLVDQEQALARYLEALFSTSPEDVREGIDDAHPQVEQSRDAEPTQQVLKPPAELSLVMVKQGELQLAFPLVDLAGVRPAPETYARLPRSAPGVLGLYAYRGQHIPVVSLEFALDMPLVPDQIDNHEIDPQVLLLGDGRWGLQVDQVMESVRVPREGVRWREDTQRSPWLVGYVRVGLVSLIDVAELVRRLDEKRRGMETAFHVVERD